MQKRYFYALLLLAFTISLVAPSLRSTVVRADTQPTYANGKIAYTDMQPGYERLWTRNGDGSNPQQILQTTDILGSPTWSPNGQKIAIYRTPTGGSGEIYVMNADGTGQTNLTNNPARDEVPAWSPKGGKIAFISDRSGGYRLYLMNEDGTNQTPIYDPASQGDRFPTWSPDGTKIYYSSVRSGSEQVYVYDTITTTTTQFTSLPNSATEPSVSPDGTKVVFAYASPSDNKLQLYVRNTDGSGFKKLFELCNDSYSQWPSWSPDGRKILFISECGTAPKSHVYMINADGTGSAQKISDTNEDAWTAPGWQWVPITSSTTNPSTGVIEDHQDGDHSDTDYEVHKNHAMFIAGKSGNVIVHGEGVLKGTGATGKIQVEDKGRLAPGSSPGCLASGDLTMNSGSALDEELGGTTACSDYDSMSVTGTVTLNNPTLNVLLYGTFIPTVGNTFTIISNDSNDAVTGTFNGLSQGTTFMTAGVTYQISYTGGDGNDIVLTVTQVSVTPGVPNTGLGLLLAGPGRILGAASVCAGVLLLLSRKLKKTSSR